MRKLFKAEKFKQENNKHMTILEKLIEALRSAAIYNRHDLASPTVVLWTDGAGQWAKIVPLLGDAIPELMILASVCDGEKQGPSTWLRYQLARRHWHKTPVIYLPGISRQAFRGAAGFPEGARHLFALQYQGQFWTQVNGKDWTASAFLSSAEGGLGLDLARDRDTLDALSTQLAHVLRTPLTSLTGRRLEAADFHGLAAADPVGLMLEWMAQPYLDHASWPAEQWVAFTEICKQSFGLDPEKEGVLVAAEKLVAGSGLWDQVWKRYGEAPKAYAGLRKVLDLVKLKDLFDHNDRIPSTNRHEEEDLRRGLVELAQFPKKEAVKKLASLCKQHVPRAKSIWADLGEAPLALAAIHLQALVDGMATGNLGSDWHGLAKAYTEKAWVIDAAAWKAYAEVRDASDIDAIAGTLRAVYVPWLEGLAEQIQAWESYPMADSANCPVFNPVPGTVLVFVDGLRCDLGLELQAMLTDSGFQVQFEARWSALPTVTATAKPAWNPVAKGLIGDCLAEGFAPQIVGTGQTLSTQLFRKKLIENDWPWLESVATGDPSSAAWTEIGTFDHDGHGQGARLAWLINDELNAVVYRVRELLNAGWKQAILVTDHGWLLVPKGLPKVDLPSHLTLSRWPRCAITQPGSDHGFKEIPWFWGGGHSVVCAPGISAFKSGVEYAHGGLSLQEALIPQISVSLGAQSLPLTVTIGSAKWSGLRLKLQLEGPYHDAFLDIRTKPADADSSLLDSNVRLKPPAQDGSASLLLTSEEYEGTAAVLVVVRDGQVVAKQSITIGED